MMITRLIPVCTVLALVIAGSQSASAQHSKAAPRTKAEQQSKNLQQTKASRSAPVAKTASRNVHKTISKASSKGHPLPGTPTIFDHGPSYVSGPVHGVPPSGVPHGVVSHGPMHGSVHGGVIHEGGPIPGQIIHEGGAPFGGGSCGAGGCGGGLCGDGLCGGGLCGDGVFNSCDSCGAACGAAGCMDCCNLYLPYLHGWEIFASFLYLRPRNVEVAYAVPVEGPLPTPNPPIQVAPTGVADLTHHSGFRVGVALAWNENTAIRASYTQLDAQDPDQITTAAPNVLAPLVSHPSIASVDTIFLQADAVNRIKFEFLDLDLRRRFISRRNFSAHWVAGVRYGHLRQEFTAQFSNLDTDNIRSELDFDGVGFRVGLEGERTLPHGFSLYGKSSASFLAGEFTADYFHGSSVDPTIVNTTWQAARIVSILELELGLAWTSCDEHWRFAAGYLFNGWFNVVRNESFIDSVRRNNFIDLSEGIGFDGLNVHGEVRF